MTYSVSRRRWAALVLALTLALFGSIVIAAPGAVSAMEPIVVDSTCSLSDAVRAANNGSTVGGCENTTTSTLIHIAPEATPSGPGVEINSDSGPVVAGAQTALPRITADITIDGLGNGIYFA